MKISRPSLILSSVGLGLTLVYCEHGANCTRTKAQQILRQKIAELNNTGALPGKDQLLADLERLHNEGKISDQQFETFKKNIRSEKHTSELQSHSDLVCRLLLEKKK